MSKDKKNMEIRAHGVELRAADKESRTVEGYAAVFDSPTEMGWYVEQVATGAFDDANMRDVVCLFNHDANQVLGRTTSETLQLSIDERGLKFKLDLPNTGTGNDLVEMVGRGDVSQCSFAFTVGDQEWSATDTAGEELRTITKIKDVYDVSLVTYPAYPDTSVALRSKPQEKEESLHSPEFRDDVAFLNRRLSVAK